ncbi:MAG: hypothetical protein ACC661_08435, partial [Verrucomicrobiales bacterium]
YYTMLGLQATHGDHVEVDKPEVYRSRVTFEAELHGETLAYRFETTRSEDGEAEVKVRLPGTGSELLYRLAKSGEADEPWAIVGIDEAE